MTLFPKKTVKLRSFRTGEPLFTQNKAKKGLQFRNKGYWVRGQATKRDRNKNKGSSVRMLRAIAQT